MQDHVDLTTARWRKSTYSNGSGGCVEVADGFSALLPVRDSKDPNGPALVFRTKSFSTFVAGVKAGTFGSV